MALGETVGLPAKPATRIQEKTANLRFIYRGTRCVLQQLIVWYAPDRSTGGQDWVDVPVIMEKEPST